MHGHVEALFLRHNELLAEFEVVHVPELDLAVGGGARHLVVLVEGVILVLLFLDLKFVGRDVLEVGCGHFLGGVVARLESERGVLDPVEVPHRSRG